MLLAQDAHYTQFENSPFFINPGSAGMYEYGDYRGNFNTRNQWRKLVKPSTTTTMSFDMPLLKYLGDMPSKSYLGIGAYGTFADAGDSKTKQSGYGVVVNGITTVGSYKTLGLGIGAGRGGVRANLSDATWDAQYNGYSYNSSLPSNEALAGAYKAKYWDFSTGLNYLVLQRKTGNSTNVGISYLHFTNPRLKKTDMINGRIDPRFVFNLRSEINMELANFLPLYLIPRFMFANQGVHNDIQAGLSIFVVTNKISQTTSFRHKEGVEAGVMYRYNDSVGLLAGYKTENWKLGVSYDITISRFGETVKRRGGAELSFTYVGFNPNLKQKHTFD
jgi:type IX secretion system PorP/SprF family membrane protein